MDESESSDSESRLQRVQVIPEVIDSLMTDEVVSMMHDNADAATIKPIDSESQSQSHSDNSKFRLIDYMSVDQKIKESVDLDNPQVQAQMKQEMRDRSRKAKKEEEAQWIKLYGEDAVRDWQKEENDNHNNIKSDLLLEGNHCAEDLSLTPNKVDSATTVQKAQNQKKPQQQQTPPHFCDLGELNVPDCNQVSERTLFEQDLREHGLEANGLEVHEIGLNQYGSDPIVEATKLQQPSIPTPERDYDPELDGPCQMEGYAGPEGEEAGLEVPVAKREMWGKSLNNSASNSTAKRELWGKSLLTNDNSASNTNATTNSVTKKNTNVTSNSLNTNSININDQNKNPYSGRIYDAHPDDNSDADIDDIQGMSRFPALPPSQCKEKGNNYFKKKFYRKARCYYEGGLKGIMSALCRGPEAMQDVTLSELDITLNLNVAQCCLNLGEPERALVFCEKVIRRGKGQNALDDKQWVKSLYKTALCYAELATKVDDCIQVLNDVIKLDPTNKAAQQLLQSKKREWNKMRKKDGKVLKNMFKSYTKDVERRNEEILMEKRARIDDLGLRVNDDFKWNFGEEYGLWFDKEKIRVGTQQRKVNNNVTDVKENVNDKDSEKTQTVQSHVTEIQGGNGKGLNSSEGGSSSSTATVTDKTNNDDTEDPSTPKNQIIKSKDQSLTLAEQLSDRDLSETLLKVKRIDRKQWPTQLKDTIAFALTQLALCPGSGGPSTKTTEEMSISGRDYQGMPVSVAQTQKPRDDIHLMSEEDKKKYCHIDVQQDKVHEKNCGYYGREKYFNNESGLGANLNGGKSSRQYLFHRICPEPEHIYAIESSITLWFLGATAGFELSLLDPKLFLDLFPKHILTIRLICIGFLGEERDTSKAGTKLSGSARDTLKPEKDRPQKEGVYKEAVEEIGKSTDSKQFKKVEEAENPFIKEVKQRVCRIECYFGAAEDVIKQQFMEPVAVTAAENASSKKEEDKDDGKHDPQPLEPLLDAQWAEKVEISKKDLEEKKIEESSAATQAVTGSEKKSNEKESDESDNLTTTSSGPDLKNLRLKPTISAQTGAHIPHLVFMFQPYLHRYFSEWWHVLHLLFELKLPICIVGGSKPDYSFDQDATIIEHLGGRLLTSTGASSDSGPAANNSNDDNKNDGQSITPATKLNPFSMEIGARTSKSWAAKCHHIILCEGGSKQKVQKVKDSGILNTKIGLIAKDLHIG